MSFSTPGQFPERVNVQSFPTITACMIALDDRERLIKTFIKTHPEVKGKVKIEASCVSQIFI
jgi:hypothetical protein